MSKIIIPTAGRKISAKNDGSLHIPDDPIIPFIEGDGIGIDITPAMLSVVDAAVEKAYGGRRKINWMEVYCGEKSVEIYGDDTWLPDETVQALREYRISIKGPLTTPVGGGIRSLNVTLRQVLDLYICQRPIRYFDGVVTPVRDAAAIDMVIFRENSEDIYSGIEWQEGTPGALKFRQLLEGSMQVQSLPDHFNYGFGVKPVSREGTQRLVRAAFDYAIAHDRASVTLVHKGNIMKYTEGAFRDWGYELAASDYGAALLDGGPWMTFKNPDTGKEIIVKDAITDAFLQWILTRPRDYDVIATLNLNGDYISDALAAQVGGIGIAPGANIGEGIALFEATHGTAPKYRGQDKVNPGSLILSAEMMLRYMAWNEAADLIVSGMQSAISSGNVTYDFARLMDGATEVKCSAFAEHIVAGMHEPPKA